MHITQRVLAVMQNFAKPWQIMTIAKTIPVRRSRNIRIDSYLIHVMNNSYEHADFCFSLYVFVKVRGD